MKQNIILHGKLNPYKVFVSTIYKTSTLKYLNSIKHCYNNKEVRYKNNELLNIAEIKN